MTNVVVMTSRDIFCDGGESSLMENKRKALLDHNVNVSYFAFSNKTKAEVRESKLPVVCLFSTWKIFIAFFWLYPLIKELKKNEVKWIVVSSPLLYFNFPVLWVVKKVFSLNISNDPQGCVEEFIDYNHLDKPYFLRLCIYWIFKSSEFLFVRACVDMAEVVSQNGGQYLKDHYGFKGKIVVVPCGVDIVYREEDVANYREKWRRVFNINHDDKCFVYCGGLSPWQNVDKVIDFASKSKAKVYIFSSESNHDYLKSFNIDNLHVHTLQHNEMLQALCAFDYGFLLRDSNLTNYVAYPNKYSEYINSRLKIILLEKNIGCISNRQELYLSFDNVLNGEDISCTVKDQVFYEEASASCYRRTVKGLASAYLAV